jgi:hypothetical protein
MLMRRTVPGSNQPRSTHRRPRLFVEHLEDRLTPSWGSIPPAVISPPLNATPVTLSAQGNATGNAIISTTEIDWYKFLVPASGNYSFQAATPLSNLDTVAALYSSAGSRINYNDDASSTNRDSAFGASLVPGKIYYLGITNYINTVGGSYTWTITGPSSGNPPPPPGGTDDAFENNDTRLTARDLGVMTSSQTYQAVMADGHDWYRFSMTSAGTTASSVAINFQHAQGDLDVELFNNSGVRVRLSATTANTESFSLSGLTAGIYYVHVLGFQGAANPSYALTINPPGGGSQPPPPPPPPSTGGYDIRLITSGLTSTQAAIFEQAAQRWEGIITAALPLANYNGMTTTGVIINASARTIDGRGGILGRAGPDRYRSGSFLPYHGVMEFDSADLSALQSSGGLVYTVLHEMGHILGIGTLWTSKGLLSGASTSNPIFTGPQATAAYNALFGTSATGVPVENSGGSGTRNAHWRETRFGNELMTGYLNTGSNPLSRVTVGSLADLGYTVDLSRADPYNPPGGAGGAGGGGGGGGTSLRAGSGSSSAIQELIRTLAGSLASNPKGKSATDAWFSRVGSSLA